MNKSFGSSYIYLTMLYSGSDYYMCVPNQSCLLQKLIYNNNQILWIKYVQTVLCRDCPEPFSHPLPFSFFYWISFYLRPSLVLSVYLSSCLWVFFLSGGSPLKSWQLVVLFNQDQCGLARLAEFLRMNPRREISGKTNYLGNLL